MVQNGSHPRDPARRILLDALDPTVERAARRKIVELLEANPAPAGSIAAARHQLDLVVQKLALNRRERAQRAELRRAAKQLPQKRLLRDVALLRLGDGDTASGVPLVLPKRLERIFFHGGIPALGLRTGVGRRVGLAVSGVLVVVAAQGVFNSYAAGRGLATFARAATMELTRLPPNPIDLPTLDALEKLSGWECSWTGCAKSRSCR